MKLKSKILCAIIMGVIFAGILSISTSSYASTGQVHLNLVNRTKSGQTYRAIEKNMWKITPFDSTGTTPQTDYGAFYCVKGGPGFRSTTDMTSGTSLTTYTSQSFNMDDPDNIPADYRSTLPTGDDYKSLVWILKHCYVPVPSTASNESIIAATTYKNELLTNAYNSYVESLGAPDMAGGLNLDQMKTVMGDNEIEIAQQLAIWVFTNDDTTWNAYNINNGYTFALSPLGNQDVKYVQALFQYLVTEAGKSANIANALTADENVQLTYWSAGTSPYDQPVVEIKREREKIFDLALRKSITKLNGVDKSSTRLPNPNVTNLYKTVGDELVTTATYNHDKTVLDANTNQEIEYTITVFNEGEIDGYAGEIKDYLPKGIEYVGYVNQADSSKFTVNEAKDTTTGKTVLTITNNEKKVLSAFNGTTLDKVEFKIKCKVTAEKTGEEQVLTNIAEITDYRGKNDTIMNDKDKDSQPANFPDDKKVNSYDGNGKVENTNYTKGQQDDDDFERIRIPIAQFDLALRKFITSIKDTNNQDVTITSRVPDLTAGLWNLDNGTTMQKSHIKTPLQVKVGYTVVYTIRIYNEGEIDGYATEITDYLPAGLKLKEGSTINSSSWTVSQDGKTIKINTLADQKIIKANGNTLDYKDVRVECEVIGSSLTNGAEITAFTDGNGNTITDRDSQAGNVNRSNYRTETSTKGKGQQDDDDYEELLLVEENPFDLSLRKFIVQVNNTPLADSTGKFIKEPVANITPLINNETTAEYRHQKEPVEVSVGDEVTYILRVYNEGDKDGYVTEITDHLPKELEFIVGDELNTKYGWTIDSSDSTKRTIKTNITSPNTQNTANRDIIYEQRKTTEDKVLLNKFNNTVLDYIDVQIKCKVVEDTNDVITNIADITGFLDSEKNSVTDRDSQAKNVVLPTTAEGWSDYKGNTTNKSVLSDSNYHYKGQQDDDDFDKLIIKKNEIFDLALRKFITGVNDTEVTNRIPFTSFNIVDDKKFIGYAHPKDPVDVLNGDTVIYTIRVYNEGTKAGYAEEVKDDIPKGLVFLPDSDLNKEYRWIMFDKDGNETEDVSKAVGIKTDYLSREQEDLTGRNNLLLPFNYDVDQEGEAKPDFRDVKIAFKVTEPNTSDRIIINKAQISKDSDDDIDSTPDEWKEGEDDQDIEKIKVRYFDLALRKWVTQAIVIENGKEIVTETGHKAEDDPEEVVKVELKESKINKTVVKFRYKIRITNEGQIAGYATEISDYIPEGLKFVQADNPRWKEVDGKIVTDQLKEKLLQPGESTEIEVLLTWINGKDNLGLKVNVAEISKDKNDSNTPDIDSTPNNKKDGEDDIDDAPVILSVKTGSALSIQYISIIGVGTVLIAGGALLIKKFILL